MVQCRDDSTTACLPYIRQTNGVGWPKPTHGLLHSGPLQSSPNGGGVRKNYFIALAHFMLYSSPPLGEAGWGPGLHTTKDRETAINTNHRTSYKLGGITQQPN